MTAPVGTRLDSPHSSAEAEDSLACSQPPLVCEPNSSGEASTPPPTDSGASRPLAPEGIRGPHADAHQQPDDLYAGAFAIKGRDRESGLELEVFSASVHDGHLQGDTQVAMARLGISSDDGHFNTRVDALTLKAHLGTQNADGSVGLNAGIGATVIGIEGTATLGPVSATLGVSASATLAGSVGVRDGDHDGKSELCARAEFGPWTLGACMERFW